MESVTVCLFTYNQGEFIQEALTALVSQTYRQFDIVVHDDGSTDNTQEMVRRFVADYDGDIRIRTILHDTNAGLAESINRVVRETTSEILVFAAGDDISLPNRLSDIAKGFSNYPQALMCWSAFTVIDGKGAIIESRKMSMQTGSNLVSGPDFRSSRCPAVLGATCAYRRILFTKFRPLRADLVYEDMLISNRAYLIGSGFYINEICVQYRMHGGNVHSSTVAPDAGHYSRSEKQTAARRQIVYEQILSDLGCLSDIKRRDEARIRFEKLRRQSLFIGEFVKHISPWRKIGYLSWGILRGRCTLFTGLRIGILNFAPSLYSLALKTRSKLK